MSPVPADLLTDLPVNFFPRWRLSLVGRRRDFVFPFLSIAIVESPAGACAFLGHHTVTFSLGICFSNSAFEVRWQP